MCVALYIAPTGCTRVFTQQRSYMLLVNNALFDNCHSVKKINEIFYSKLFYIYVDWRILHMRKKLLAFSLCAYVFKRTLHVR
jgi:hypothetical protein